MILIKNAKVVLQHGILDNGAVLLDGERIAAVGPAEEICAPDGTEVIDAKGAYVGPGFVDIHVHGGSKWMFHSHPEEAAGYFLAHGETTQLATLYYDLSKEEFPAAIRRVKAAMEQGAGRAIAGFYMEGPYMNPKYGASPEKNQWRGTIRSEDYLPLLSEAGAFAKVWAVAPERAGVEAFMGDAKEANPAAVFAVGHSEATPAEIAAVRHYGVTLQTHCMDATGRTTKWLGTRGAGPDEACLLDDSMYAELICDSLAVHVNPDLQKLILKVKGVDRVILISDSFVSNEEAPEELSHVQDLSFDAGGNLSGSRLTLDAACRNVMNHTGCSIREAFLMASLNPARAIGMADEIGSVEAGKKADLVIVDGDFHIQTVIFHGQVQSSERK